MDISTINKAYNSGVSGSKAMTVGILCLMWLDSITNFQYKHGTSFKETVKILYSQGGIRRFYAGLIPALLLGPIGRFTDTFTNSLAMEGLSRYHVPIFIKTGVASITTGLIRIILTPLDSIKVRNQVKGNGENHKIVKGIKSNGIMFLYKGGLANGLLTVFGHYPWFVTHNYLDSNLPKFGNKRKNVMRNALIGCCSSIVAETCSNFMNLIKTRKQTSEENKGYNKLLKQIVHQEGIKSLLFTGLRVKIISSSLNGILFNVMWKYFDIK